MRHFLRCAENQCSGEWKPALDMPRSQEVLQDHEYFSLVHTYFLVLDKVFFVTEPKCLIGSLLTSEKDHYFQLIFFVWMNRYEHYSWVHCWTVEWAQSQPWTLCWPQPVDSYQQSGLHRSAGNTKQTDWCGKEEEPQQGLAWNLHVTGILVRFPWGYQRTFLSLSKEMHHTFPALDFTILL